MFNKRRLLAIGLILCVTFVSLNCAPGNDRWDQGVNPGHKAGFWAGIWHGLIVIITFIVSLFTHEVGLYETSNTGWPYNLGFIIGLFILFGCFLRAGKRKPRRRDWAKIGDEVEERVRLGIKAWLDETDQEKKEKEWEEIASKVEEKIKRALKDWAEKK